MQERRKITGAALSIDPEAAEKTAEEIWQNLRRLRRMLEDLKLSVEKTDKFWEGEAGNAHRKSFYKRWRQTEILLGYLEKAVSDFRQINALYMRTEKTAAAEAEELPGDLIP